MLAANLAEVVQLTVGAILGTVVSFKLDRLGLSLVDPKTRWKAAGVTLAFLFTFLVLSDLLIN